MQIRILTPVLNAILGLNQMPKGNAYQSHALSIIVQNVMMELILAVGFVTVGILI